MDLATAYAFKIVDDAVTILRPQPTNQTTHIQVVEEKNNEDWEYVWLNRGNGTWGAGVF